MFSHQFNHTYAVFQQGLIKSLKILSKACKKDLRPRGSKCVVIFGNCCFKRGWKVKDGLVRYDTEIKRMYD